jgi:beta-xylosidase
MPKAHTQGLDYQMKKVHYTPNPPVKSKAKMANFTQEEYEDFKINYQYNREVHEMRRMNQVMNHHAIGQGLMDIQPIRSSYTK